MIQSLDFESGATVKAEQFLALDSDVENANLKSSQARLPAAKAKYERYRGLLKKGLSLKKPLMMPKRLTSLVADIESLKATIERRTIKHRSTVLSAYVMFTWVNISTW